MHTHPASRFILKRFLTLVSIVVLVATFSGCASYNRIAEYPSKGTPPNVEVVSKPMSRMSEMPVGTYYDEPRHIIVSGHQKGLGWGMLFGVVGVVVADQANKSSAETRFGSSANSSTVDLSSITREIMQEEITARSDSGWKSGTATPQLQLSTHALFTVQKSGKARLYAILRAEIPGAEKPTWAVRYFAAAPNEHPVEGPDGWMADGRFADGIRIAIRDAIRVCMDDTRGNLTTIKKVKAKGLFPYLNIEKFELPFLIVQETPTTLVGRLAAGDVMVMAGTHVLRKSDYEIKDADFKDPRQ